MTNEDKFGVDIITLDRTEAIALATKNLKYNVEQGYTDMASDVLDDISTLNSWTCEKVVAEPCEMSGSGMLYREAEEPDYSAMVIITRCEGQYVVRQINGVERMLVGNKLWRSQNSPNLLTYEATDLNDALEGAKAYLD